MPVITVKTGKTAPETKKALIEELTAAASKVTNIPASSYSIYIEELELDNIGVGGQTVAERMAGK